VESSWVIIRKDPAMLMHYNEYCRRMHSNKAIIKIARHLLSRIRYVWLKEEPYQKGQNLFFSFIGIQIKYIGIINVQEVKSGVKRLNLTAALKKMSATSRLQTPLLKFKETLRQT